MSRIDDIMQGHHRYKYAKRMQTEASAEIDKAIANADEILLDKARTKAERADKIMKSIRLWATKQLGGRLIQESINKNKEKHNE